MKKSKNINHLIGYKLRTARQQTELSQIDVAKQINFSSTHLCNIEAGRREAPLPLLVLLTKIYNQDPVVFLKDIVDNIG